MMRFLLFHVLFHSVVQSILALFTFFDDFIDFCSFVAAAGVLFPVVVVLKR